MKSWVKGGFIGGGVGFLIWLLALFSVMKTNDPVLWALSFPWVYISRLLGCELAIVCIVQFFIGLFVGLIINGAIVGALIGYFLKKCRF